MINAFQTLKQQHFQTSDIVLHSRDIRKWQKAFKSLGDVNKRHRFYKDLDQTIEDTDFTIIASAILKNELIDQYGPQANNPYDLSLTFILERLVFYTDRLDCNKVSVVAESRGKKEDAKLHDQYQIVINNGTKYVSADRFKQRLTDIEFRKKEANVIGTQISDLVAYPLATKIVYPDRENLAFRTIDQKIYRQFPQGDYLGYGLKIFP